MAKHPSLNLPFKQPSRLQPRRKMGRNETCWCGSQKKWKDCHYRREEQVPENIEAQLKAMRTEFKKGYCLHPKASDDTCSKKIIRSHTLQRKGGLSAIAENGHVISIKIGFEKLYEHEGRVIPDKIGLRSASTFMGFCNRHDTEMFRPVETGKALLTDENCFLLSYRALAYEYFQKTSVLNTKNIMREMDKGNPFEVQCAIQEQLNVMEQGERLGMRDLEAWKRQYDDAFLAKKFGAYKFYSVAFSDILPVVACGAFQPEFDFQGTALQKLGRGQLEYESITYNLTVLNGHTVAVLSWRGEDEGPAWAFAQSLKTIPSAEKADATVRLAFEHLENTYMNPTWWYELPEKIRQATIRRMSSGLPAMGRSSDCLKPDEFGFLFEVKMPEEIAP